MRKILLTCIIIGLTTLTGNALSNAEQVNTISPPIIQKILSNSEQKKFDELCQKADELLEQNQPNKAHEYIVKASELNNKSDMIYALSAKNLASATFPDYNLVKSSAENSLKINSNNYIALDMLGYVYLTENKFEQALSYFEKSIQQNSDYTLPIFHLGELYSQKKDYKKAAEYYNMYISKNNINRTKSVIVEKAYYYRGYDYIKQDKFDNAFEDGSVLIALNSKNPYGYSLKAMAMANMPNKKKEALKLADKSIKLDFARNSADLYINKIYTYGIVHNWDWTVELELMNDFTNAERWSDKNIKQLHELLNIYQKFAEHNQKNIKTTYLGKMNKTAKKILNINPNDEQAQKICNSSEISLAIAPRGTGSGSANVSKSLSSGAINCYMYPYNDDKIYSDSWEYVQNYLQCTFDKQIIPLNNNFKYKEQNNYWENINSVLEHKYENSDKYGKGIPNTLPGKYNTMAKIDNLVYKEYTIYQLGKIITGNAEYHGPEYMYGEGSWQDYINAQIDENKGFSKLSDTEKTDTIERLMKQMNYFAGYPNIISNAYDFNVYICNLIGIAKNYDNGKFKQAIKDFYIKNKKDNTLKEIIIAL